MHNVQVNVYLSQLLEMDFQHRAGGKTIVGGVTGWLERIVTDYFKFALET